ncbi:MAG: LOG family protein [Hyphomicrobium sp.]
MHDISTYIQSILSREGISSLSESTSRPLRLADEFHNVDTALRQNNVNSTIVVFGSSRVIEAGHLSDNLKCISPNALEDHLKFYARHARWYQMARDFGRVVSERGGALASNGTPLHNVITTGGGPGIMEAANRGASDAGAKSIGFNIILPNEQPANNYSTPELTFRFRYFAIRKMHFAMRAKALVIFPGGFGTLDELFEILTLKQVRRVSQLPVVLFDREYWSRVINFQALYEARMIDHYDTCLFEYVDEVEEAWNILQRYELDIRPPLRDS